MTARQEEMGQKVEAFDSKRTKEDVRVLDYKFEEKIKALDMGRFGDKIKDLKVKINKKHGNLISTQT